MLTYSDNIEFLNIILKAQNESNASFILEDAINWIRSNLRPEDVFDFYELTDWAYENGFFKEND